MPSVASVTMIALRTSIWPTVPLDAVARVVVLRGGLRGDEPAACRSERDGQGEGDGRRDTSFH